MVNEPAGITIISGQFRHSLKVCPGAREAVGCADVRCAARAPAPRAGAVCAERGSTAATAANTAAAIAMLRIRMDVPFMARRTNRAYRPTNSPVTSGSKIELNVETHEPRLHNRRRLE